MDSKKLFILIAFIFTCNYISVYAQQEKALTLQDVMQFRHIRETKISDNGEWVVYTAEPDRGDSEVHVKAASGRNSYTIALADRPLVSHNGRWVAARKNAPALEIENTGKNNQPKSGVVLLNTITGERVSYDSIQSFSFSNDGSWFFLHTHSVLEKKEEKKYKDFSPGTELMVISLEEQRTDTIRFVTNFATDSLSSNIAYAVADTTGLKNAVYTSPLAADGLMPQKVLADSALWADQFAWNNTTGSLAFIGGIAGDEGRRDTAHLFMVEPGAEEAEIVLTDASLDRGWRVYHKNKLIWNYDGACLFLGTKPADEIVPPKDENDSISNLYDTEQILAEREVDVWHWDDPFINPNQKKSWKKEKDRTYRGVYIPSEDRFVQLADSGMRGLRLSKSAGTLLGIDDLKYAKRRTWDGWYSDYYVVDVVSGDRRLVLEEQQHSVRLSPDGEYLVYYRDGNWFLYNVSSGVQRNLTSSLEVCFANEDWDYPRDVPGYGVAGWMEGSSAVLIYDKYDIWQFDTQDGSAVCLTGGLGRDEKLIFRVRDLEKERQWFEDGESLLVYGYHDLEKHRAVYSMKAGESGVELLLGGEKKYSLLAKAEDADQVLFSRMSYSEFPDLHVVKSNFRKPVKLSSLGDQTEGFAWGEPELVDWLSVDGRKIQGILIKPGNYEPGKKYPVLVYYYRFFTNRLYNFPHMAVNHRPNFPYYASNGYAIFLPDIRFDIGTPGYAATKSLVPGVQKIIDMGIADPDAIALHGHSWSGYQTAFMITQTDIFACAIAGAPVSNMTSAYSGIRWGTGLARQFQYEKSQSRIGGSLWESRDKYIENSPVFFADRINTPLLIQFGDKDGAVPWYQGIELYLAMRRLEKDCVFLQYRGEDHHLKKYANKLDYTIKFKAYLDHYLKGERAADWIKEGVEFKGE